MAKLSQIDVGEVSLVDKAANKRKFLILKSKGEEDMPELILEVKKGSEDFFKNLAESVIKDDSILKVIESVQDENVRKSLDLVTGDDVVKAILKAMEDDTVKATLEIVSKSKTSMGVISAIAKDSDIDADVEAAINKAEGTGEKKLNIAQAIKAALKALSTAKADLPKDIMDTLAKFSGIKKAVSGLTGIRKNDDGSLDLSDVPENMHATVTALFKSNEEATRKVEETEKVLKAERNERLNAAFIEKAQGYTRLSMDATTFGPILKKMAEDLTNEEFAEVERVLKAASNSLDELFKAKGVDGGSNEDDDNSAYSQLAKKAEVIAKRDGITPQQAFVKALDEYPKLAEQEREEKKAS